MTPPKLAELHWDNTTQLFNPFIGTRCGMNCQNHACSFTPQHGGSCGDPSKAFSCTVCGRSFARRPDLARHAHIHTGIRPHICDWPGCNKNFIQRSALTVHARIHTGEKPYSCQTCTKRFRDASGLSRHRRIHSGKRPYYKCAYAECQKRFTRRTTLTTHQKRHMYQS
ncbi:hypothetical protein L211DRAFT_819043 [Terfezia boudieri ATCC MYA-4762]|uniref:C2H2-type domain-containing protein n=1 Tax=Terfezia boudieri ATCC MYA-4762 TaxID=1051890 RepID=A0A3N4MGZ0_9PEZI|nr:hypothetical protein L211DRAFT_819043 [Terfezia boudieri ATCC MYA-4762]